jgi:outer membrane protein assembly factor BamB
MGWPKRSRASTSATVLWILVALTGCASGPAPLSIAGIGILPTPASAWPSAQFDARHSSASEAVGPQSATVRWSRDLGGNLTPGPVIGVDGSIIAATNSGVIHALDPATGAERWSFDGDGSYGNDLSTSPSVLGDGTILWPGPKNTLVALTQDGALLWKEAFAGQVLSPAVAGLNRVYVADMSGALVALEVADGRHRRLWSLDLGGTTYASPSVGPDGTIFAAAQNDLVAVADLGERASIRWRFHSSSLIEVSSGVSADGIVVLGTNNDHQYGIRSDGSIAWKLKIDAWSYSSSAVRPDGLAYFSDNKGVVHTVDSATGEVVLRIAPAEPGREYVWTSVLADAQGNTYWASLSGNIYGYSSAGRQLFRLNVGQRIDGYPALGQDGTLYVGTTRGELYAIRD